MSRNANNPISILKSFIFSQQILIHSTGWQYTDYVRMSYPGPGCGEYRVKPQDMCFVLRGTLITRRSEGSQGFLLRAMITCTADTQLVFASGRRARLWALSVIVFREFLVFIVIIHRLPQLVRVCVRSTPGGSMRGDKGERTISNSSWHSLRCAMTMPCPSGIDPSMPTNLPSLRMESIWYSASWYYRKYNQSQRAEH